MNSAEFSKLLAERSRLNKHSSLNQSLLEMPEWLRNEWREWEAAWAAAKPTLTPKQRKLAGVA